MDERLHIIGGNPLRGHVKISGAKNAALAIMAGAILAEDEVLLDNIPNLTDVQVMSTVLNSLGVNTKFSNNQLLIDSRNINNYKAPYELVTKLRASFFILGPLVARSRQAIVPLPGGCSIGSRPVDLHLKGLQALGAKYKIEHGNVIVSAPKLEGTSIYLDYPSVGATENIMMAATLAEGTTIIDNAAQEPEIKDLANFLTSIGAKIRGAGTDTIIVEGVEKLNYSSTYSIMPDRIEAGTFMIAAASNGGNVIIDDVNPEILQSVISKLRECGVSVEIIDKNKIRVRNGKPIKPVDIKTLPYPGFPTDLQAQITSLLTTSIGTSVITETVFENRFLHADELRRMGAQIRIEGNCAIIRGIEKLSGAPVRATDLRAGAALVIAGLKAEGETIITKLNHIDRGYENFEEKLSQLGAKIKRISIKTESNNSLSSRKRELVTASNN